MAISDYVTVDSLKEALESKFGFVEDLSNKDKTIHVMVFNGERVEIPSISNEYKDACIIVALKKVVEIFPEMKDPAFVLFSIMPIMVAFASNVKGELEKNGIELWGDHECTASVALQYAIALMIEVGYKLD